jgi:glucose/arabinose dehydrogenase
MEITERAVLGAMVTRRLLVAMGVALLALAAFIPLRAALAAPPAGFVDLTIETDIFTPVQLAMAPDGRLVVVKDEGTAVIIVNDQALNTPFLDISDRVNSDGDRGMFSMAFDNNFAANGYIYVMYVHDDNKNDNDPGNPRLSRFTVTGNSANENTEVVLFDEFPTADVDLHYGGAVQHGNDGRLYVSVGDYLIGPNAQDNTNIKGTMLRLNTDGSIPTSNPFYDELQGNNRAIYANGLRNPWNTEEHPTTGEIYISDVGSNSWEELNVLGEGNNYGWRLVEGPEPTPDPDLEDPFWAFPHADANGPDTPGTPIKGCAIIGGAFYETPVPTFPTELRGKYFTGDYCSGQIVSVDTTTGIATNFMTLFDDGDPGVSGLVDFAVSPVNGDLYYLDRNFKGDQVGAWGGVGKIQYVGEINEISITSQPGDVSIAAGGTASFFVGAAAPGDVTYQWFRNGNAINGATGPRLTIDNVGPGDDGDDFTVEISNGNETVTSDEATINITNNTVPEPTITVGAVGGGYEAGKAITFSGSATDAEDGNIPSEDLRWEVRLNHDDHDHPLVNAIVGANGSFTVPPAIESDTNVWVTLYLTATDSDGTSWTTSARVDPLITTVTLQTSPAGLDVSLEGQTHQAPFSFDSVAGVVREISAPVSQTDGGVTYTFESWSDGFGRDAIRPTADVDETIVATYSGGAGGDVCTAEALDGGGVRVSWQNKAGTEIVRSQSGNNGGDGWVTTPAAGTLSYVDADGDTDFGYYIRRSGGVADEVCDVVGDPVDPPDDAECVVTAVAGGVFVDWDAVPGENRYSLRVNGSFAVLVANATQVTWDGGTLNDVYSIRYDLQDGNGKQNLACENDGDVDPPDPDICTVTDLANGVRVDWLNKPGTEIVRFQTGKNGGDGWVTTPGAGTLSYVDADGDTDFGYYIRRTGGGDEVCNVL